MRRRKLAVLIILFAIPALACGVSLNLPGDEDAATPTGDELVQPVDTATAEILPTFTPEQPVEQPTESPTEESTPIPEPEVEFTTYTNTELGVVFQYPSDWIVDDDAGLITLASDSALLENDELLAESGVIALVVSGPVDEFGSSDPEAMLSEIIADFDIVGTDAVVNGPFADVINGMSGARASLTGTDENDVELSAAFAFVVLEERATLLAAASRSDLFAGFEDQIEKLFTSIELIEVIESEPVAGSAGAAISVGETIEGTLEDSSAIEYIVESVALSPLTILVEPLGEWDVVLTVFSQSDPDGLNVEIDDGFSGEPETFLLIPAGSTPYVIGLRGFGGATGDYSLTVSESEHLGTGTGHSQLVVSDSLAENDAHIFPFTTLSAEQSILFTVQPESGIDIVLELYVNGTDELLETVDNAFDREDATFELQEAGDYYIRLTEFSGQSGQYDAIMLTSDSVIIDLAAGDIANGDIKERGFIEYYVDLAQGDSIRITVATASDLDAVLEVSSLSNPGTVLVEMDQSPAGGVEFVELTAPAEDTYLITITDISGSGGLFNLTIE